MRDFPRLPVARSHAVESNDLQPSRGSGHTSFAYGLDDALGALHRLPCVSLVLFSTVAFALAPTPSSADLSRFSGSLPSYVNGASITAFVPIIVEKSISDYELDEPFYLPLITAEACAGDRGSGIDVRDFVDTVLESRDRSIDNIRDEFIARFKGKKFDYYELLGAITQSKYFMSYTATRHVTEVGAVTIFVLELPRQIFVSRRFRIRYSHGSCELMTQYVEIVPSWKH